jgi:hypothetical protein
MSSDFRTVDLEIESRIRIDYLTLQWTYNKRQVMLPKSPQGDEKLTETDAVASDKEADQSVIASSGIGGRRYVPSFAESSRDQAGPSIIKPSEKKVVVKPRAMMSVSKNPLAWGRDFFALAWRASMEILVNEAIQI